MKKSSCLLIVSVSAFLFMISCKHAIPGTGPGTGSIPPIGGGSTPPATTSCSPDTAYFQQQVLPIFISNCSLSGCHDNASHQKGVILTSYNYIVSSGNIQPGNPSNSKIYKKITEMQSSDRMPPLPRNALSATQIDIIRKWILQGAKNNSCQSAGCDTSNVTYSITIKSIISAKCQGCHSSSSPAGGYDYTSYAGVKARVTDGKLWGAVNHLSGFSPMPKNGNKLSTCELAQIKKWMDAGAPNN